MSDHKIKVLLIEDDAVDQLAFRRFVDDERLPYAFSIAGSVSDAKKILPLSDFDLVISDYSLGDGTVFDAIDFQKHAPVVILTGAGNEEIAVSAMKKGAYDYMSKDIDRNYLKVLPIIAENAIRRKKADDELKKYRERLIELVDERTRELNDANEQLKKEMAERKQAEAEAIRSSQLASIGELAAGVAHEVNNPVNGIINYAQILLNSLEPGSRESDIAARIIKEGDRIANLTSNLLSFAHDARKEKRPYRLINIIESCIALTGAQLKNDGIKLKINIPAAVPPVKVNLQQMEQVVLNIISNARYALNRKFDGEHLHKKLSIHSSLITVNGAEYVRLSFQDTGTGIPEKLLDRVTEPFFTTKPANVGTGLGLSISHGIITDHSGRMSIESTEGEWTTVIIDLPAENN